jgi:hypothetical protein
MKSVLLLAFLLLLPAPVLAWGPQGHEIVAQIAAREMTPAARTEVEALLSGDAAVMMSANANWADEIRQDRPETAAWHFVDIELGATHYDPARDCPRSDCIVAQIQKDRRILADRHAPLPDRIEALRFLIHFLGDIHQPLHAADDHDRGGNDIAVRVGRYRTSLHRLWDGDVVTALGDDPALVAARIDSGFSRAQKLAWEKGTPADWAFESFLIAEHDIYAPLHGRKFVVLPRDYAARQAPIVRAQLEKAGLRLAMVLDEIFR